MHDSSLSQLLSSQFTKAFEKDSLFASNSLSFQNKEQLREVAPINQRVPTGEEVREMKQWEIKYRTQHPKASERQVKRAVVAQFNIVVFEGQNMIPK